jgi:lipopolysaccharide exporter
MSSGLQGQMTKGAIWMVLFKLVERSLGLLSTLILARLLLPSDFGVVAMALSFIAMAELLTAVGFDVALIQKKNATTEHYNTAWTGNVVIGLSITALMLVLAIPIAHFYDRQELVPVVCLLALGPLLTGTENIGVVAFRKDMDFRREFKFQISRKLISFCVVVPMAFILRNYWALVAGTLASKLAGTTMSYLMHPFRPRPMLSHLKELFHFSRWILFNNIVSFFKERTADFFIGRIYGAQGLGVYNISAEFAHLPSTELGAPINRALLPGFSRMSEIDEIRRSYANAVGMLAFLALPAAASIFAIAPFLVPVVLGPKWLDSVPLMQTLAFNGALLMFHASMSTVLFARGFPARVTGSNVGYVVLLAGLLAAIAPRFGLLGAAYAVLLTSVLSTPIYLYQMNRCLGIGPFVFLKAVARPAGASFLMAALVRWVLPEFLSSMPLASLVSWLVTGILLCALTYIASVALLWLAAGRPPGSEQALLERRRRRLQNRPATGGGTV